METHIAQKIVWIIMMEYKKEFIIAVDIDDTYWHLVNRWLELYNSDYNDNLTEEDITGWNIGSFTKCGDKFYDYLYDDTLYDGIKLIDGALKTINKMRSRDNRVIFVTAGANPNKMNAVMKTGGLSKKEDFIMAYDKSLIMANILIDDKFENVVSFPKLGILLDKPWNRKYDYRYRAMNWKDVDDMLFGNWFSKNDITNMILGEEI